MGGVIVGLEVINLLRFSLIAEEKDHVHCKNVEWSLKQLSSGLTNKI